MAGLLDWSNRHASVKAAVAHCSRSSTRQTPSPTTSRTGRGASCSKSCDQTHRSLHLLQAFHRRARNLGLLDGVVVAAVGQHAEHHEDRDRDQQLDQGETAIVGRGAFIPWGPARGCSRVVALRPVSLAGGWYWRGLSSGRGSRRPTRLAKPVRRRSPGCASESPMKPTAKPGQLFSAPASRRARASSRTMPATGVLIVLSSQRQSWPANLVSPSALSSEGG